MFEPISEDELRELLRVEIPPTPARAGWEFDISAIKQALDMLDIRLPVRIRFITAPWRCGTHYARKDYHRITLNQSHDIERANYFLWHELAHAHQAEAWSRRTNKSQVYFHEEAYGLHGVSGQAYVNNPFEVHANEVAKQFSPTYLLLKESK